AFERLRNAVRASLHEMTAEVVRRVETVLRLAHGITVRIDEAQGDAVRAAVDDLREQLSGLVYPGFVAGTGYRRLPDLARYLRGMERPLDKLPENPGRDAVSMAVAQRVERAYRQAVAGLLAARRADEDRHAVR